MRPTPRHRHDAAQSIQLYEFRTGIFVRRVFFNSLDFADFIRSFFLFFFFSQKPFCIEILHEQSTPLNVTIVVHCESNEDRNKEGQLSFEFLSKPRFLNITRCCSNNQVFNLARGTCEPSTNEDDFLTLFPKDELRSRNIEIVSIGKRLLKCPTSTAMFTYEIDAADVIILDESLKVSIFYFIRSR